MFQLNAQVVITLMTLMTTGAFSQNISKVRLIAPVIFRAKVKQEPTEIASFPGSPCTASDRRLGRACKQGYH